MSKTILVIIPDSISDILKKGEYPNRYYNPGEVFDDVHILMINDDHPDPNAVQKTVGRAKLYLHNLPAPSLPKTLGWQPWLMRSWVRQGIDLARQIRPQIVRTHGNHLNGYLAAQIKDALKIPLLTSLHINADEDVRGRQEFWKDPISFLFSWSALHLEGATLRQADLVMPVYEPILDYTHKHGAKHVRVCYNMLNTENIVQKTDYSLHDPPRMLSVGRQTKHKNPENLIRAVAHLDAHLTLVGNGDYHQYLQQVAQDCGISDRVTFYPALPNDELCAMLRDFDIFATHSEYWELSKSVLEPLLTGLPIVLNRRIGKPVPELQGDWVCLVENTPEGYLNALTTLLEDHGQRESLGRRAYTHSQEKYDPARNEQIFADIYQSFLSQ